MEKDEHRYEGNVKLAASLDEAAEQLINNIAPVKKLFRSVYRHLDVEVMFNEPSINAAVRHGNYEKWKGNRFEYKVIQRRKEAIAHGGKWYTLSVLLDELDGKLVWYNSDETMNHLVETLKYKPGRKDYGHLITGVPASSD